MTWKLSFWLFWTGIVAEDNNMSYLFVKPAAPVSCIYFLPNEKIFSKQDGTWYEGWCLIGVVTWSAVVEFY